MNEQRDFKGIWITREVWLDKRLNALEKIIFAEIDSLDGENGCFASNQYLSDFCQCSLTKVSTAISKLIGLGYIYASSFDGRTRILKSRLSKNERQDFKKCEADVQEVKENNIGNNQNDNGPPITPDGGEVKKNHVIGDGEGGIVFVPIDATPAEIRKYVMFAKFWNAYPRKVDRKGSERAFLRIKNVGEVFPAIMDALEKQKRSDQWTKDGGAFIPHPKTWINGERWNDEFPKEKRSDGDTYDVDDFMRKALDRSYANETEERKWH